MRLRHRAGGISRAGSGLAALLAASAALAPLQAAAQRSGENVVASADDAFGTALGNEKIGIYSDQDVRGFSPVKAGNVRLAGVYFDQMAPANSRMRSGSAIRVGAATLDYPFPAPTGIVDLHLRVPGDKKVVSVAISRQPFGASNNEIDSQIPILPDRLRVSLGLALLHEEYVDGASTDFVTLGIIPRYTFDGGEIIPVIGVYTARNSKARPVITAAGPFVPALPETRRYIGQSWSQSDNDNGNVGVITRFRLGEQWSVQAGLWDSWTERLKNYTEVFSVENAAGASRHLVIADPEQSARSISGEAQLVWKRQAGRLRHSVLFMVRGRDRMNETGGSDLRDLGPVVLGAAAPEAEPVFRYGAVDVGRIKQITGAVGYVGQMAGVGRINLGLQKTRYEASFERLGRETATTQTPLLYNAAAVATPRRWLTLYTHYVKGLEDSGVAPENAVNRNEQLPALLTSQFDGGVRLSRGKSRLVVSAFSISKPYFDFDGANRFTSLGDVRHRGVEASVATSIGARLDLLAGAVLMDPVVTADSSQAGGIGKRPVGTTRTLVRLDADYRTPIAGLSLSSAVVHSGPRTASARTYAQLGGRQLETPALTTVDIGARYRFVVHDTPMSVRVLASNIFDERSWKVVASNSYQLADTRRVLVSLVADF